MPQAQRRLVMDATLISMDETVGNLHRASILIEGERIAEIGPELAIAAETDAELEIIDASGMIAIPGLVDAHRHLWQSPLAMVAADADLDNYFAEVPGKLAPVYAPDDLRIANRVGALQALDAGVTTLFDWCHVLHTPAHADAAVAGLRDSRIRAVFAHGFPNTEPAWSMDSERPMPADARRVRRELLSSDTALVTMAIALRGPEQSTLEVTTHDLSLARDLGLRISMHAGNGSFGLPYRTVERLHDAGLMGPDIQYVHCTSLSDESVRRIVDSGATMVSTPTVETQMQFGFPDTTRFLAAGLRPGLGADVVTSTDGGLFSEMACAFQAARLQAVAMGTSNLTTANVFSFATLDGAAAVGLEREIGSLSVGKQADIVLLRPDPLAPMNDPVGFTVLGATAASVDSVLIAGQPRKRDGRLLCVDAPAERARLESCRDRLFERAGFTPPGDRKSAG